MASIFTKIINREIPAYILDENDEFIAILDAFPLVPGHALIIPKKETDYLFDMEDGELSRFHVFGKKIAIAQKKAIECKKIGVAVIGLEVPHAHIHLIPMNEVKDMNFANPKLKIEKAEMEIIRDRIKSYL
jgi:histidine triad (HIT) family protein